MRVKNDPELNRGLQRGSRVPQALKIMPTICLDCRYIKDRPSGIGSVVQALVDHLPHLAPDWHFRFLRHPSRQEPLSASPNVSEEVVTAEVNGPAGMWWLRQFVDLDDIDLFHAPSNILPRGLTMPCVTTIHDTMWLSAPHLCNSAPWGHVEKHFYRHGMRRAMAQSAAILTVSEATRTALVELDPRLAFRTSAILPGVSNAFSPSPEESRPPQDNDGPGYILTVGQNAPYKNHEGAIRGFAKAFADDARMKLVLVQRRGTASARLEALSDKLGIAEQVQFVTTVGRQELVDLYRGATALLHPSFVEGFGMPLAEAMACGCPIIASECSAMPEVTDGAALLVDPGNHQSIADALVQVTNDPKLAADLARKGLVRAQQLSWREFARGNLETYRRVLGLA